MLWPFEKLTILDAAELRERSIGRLVAPNALAWRKHRIAAVALFVVAVVLVAVNDDLVADLPPLDLRADGPNDARGIGACDMVGLLVDVEHRHRRPERCPYAVVVDACRHHEDEDVVTIEFPRRNDLDLHRRFRKTFALLADRPGIHILRDVAERRNLPDFVEVFLDAGRRR